MMYCNIFTYFVWKANSRWFFTEGKLNGDWYHVEIVLRVRAPLQVPDEDVPVVAGRQDDAGVEWVRLQDKNLSLVALERRGTLVLSWGELS